MLNITATCICNADTRTGVSKDNLLFSGQILPEVNGGLAGTPSVKTSTEVGFFAAVLDGETAAAAHFAASTLRDTPDPDLRSPEALLRSISIALADSSDGEAPAPGCSGAVVCVRDDLLALAAYGSCRAYLLRDRSLFLLYGPDAPSEAGQPYAITGSPIAGDRLLLCTDGLSDALDAAAILQLLFSARSDPDALQQLLQQARTCGAQDSVTALLLRFA